MSLKNATLCSINIRNSFIEWKHECFESSLKNTEGTHVSICSLLKYFSDLFVNSVTLILLARGFQTFKPALESSIIFHHAPWACNASTWFISFIFSLRHAFSLNVRSQGISLTNTSRMRYLNHGPPCAFHIITAFSQSFIICIIRNFYTGSASDPRRNYH